MKFLWFLLFQNQKHVKHGWEDEGDGVGGYCTHNIEHVLNIIHGYSDAYNESKENDCVNYKENLSFFLSFYFILCFNVRADLLHVIITHLFILSLVFTSHQNNTFYYSDEVIPSTEIHDRKREKYRCQKTNIHDQIECFICICPTEGQQEISLKMISK
jgi:hypothetical protein